MKLGGELNRYELLRSKVKYFSEGLVIGSQSFIVAQRRKFLKAKGADDESIEVQLQRGRRKELLSSDTLVTWRW